MTHQPSQPNQPSSPTPATQDPNKDPAGWRSQPVGTYTSGSQIGAAAIPSPAMAPQHAQGTTASHASHASSRAPERGFSPQLQNALGGIGIAMAWTILQQLAGLAEPYFIAFMQHLIDLRQAKLGPGSGQDVPSESTKVSAPAASIMLQNGLGTYLGTVLSFAEQIAELSEPYFLDFMQHLIDLRKQQTGG